MSERNKAVVEAAARALCRSGRFETGEGACAVVCMDQLGEVRKKGCHHVLRVHQKLAEGVATAMLEAQASSLATGSLDADRPTEPRAEQPLHPEEKTDLGELVERLLVEHVRKINRVVAAGMHEGDAIKHAAEAITQALNAKSAAGEDMSAQGCGDDPGCADALPNSKPSQDPQGAVSQEGA